MNSTEVDNLHLYFMDTVEFPDYALTEVPTEYYDGIIYEDFVLSVDTFFESSLLAELVKHGFITEQIQHECMQVAKEVIRIATEKPYPVNVKLDSDWQNVFSLMKKIGTLVKNQSK